MSRALAQRFAELPEPDEDDDPWCPMCDGTGDDPWSDPLDGAEPCPACLGTGRRGT